MGGLIFHEQGGRRMTTSEYNNLKTDVEHLLAQDLGLEALFPEVIEDKADHGDLDVVVPCYSGALCSEERGILQWLNGSPHHQNGNVISFLRSGFQVDLILVPAGIANFAVKYYSFGDLSNLLGYYARHIGLRLGQGGLYRENNIPNLGIEKIYVTSCWDEALEKLGVSPERYHKGFKGISDVFEYIKSSTLFSHDVFSMEKTNSAQRARIRKRKNQKLFFQMLDAERIRD